MRIYFANSYPTNESRYTPIPSSTHTYIQRICIRDMSDDSHDETSTRGATTASISEVSATEERAPNTWLNAIIGGVIGVVFSIIPLSTVIGGAVAGYLEGGDYSSGAKVGALAGLIAFIPFVFILGIMLFIRPIMGPPGPGSSIAFWIMLLFALCFAAVYVVGLSILGGVLGVYVKEEV